jgi:hypothetical protein
MSNIEPTEPYIYQPYGMQDKENWKTKRVYGVGGLASATIKGISKELAEKIVEWLKGERIRNERRQ